MCAFSAPFIYHGFQNREKNNKLIAHLTELAQSKSANPKEIETWRYQYALGIDLYQNVLVYVRHGIDSFSSCLDLGDYGKVNLIKNFQNPTTTAQTQKLPEFVALELVPKVASKEVVLLEIYDAEHYSDLLGETVLAEKWFELIKNQLK